MKITIQLDVDELKELLNGKTKSVIKDYITPVMNTRLCIKCNAEFVPKDDNQHYCSSCQSKKK